MRSAYNIIPEDALTPPYDAVGPVGSAATAAAWRTLQSPLKDLPPVPPPDAYGSRPSADDDDADSVHDSGLSPSDVLQWLAAFFGFQRDNVRNQREHVLLLLANYQMRRGVGGGGYVEAAVVQQLRQKLLKNYVEWCAFLRQRSSLKLPRGGGGGALVDGSRELLYSCLFLLIWGEAANLRFMPECLCFLFHHMAAELNKILDSAVDPETGHAFLPASFGRDAFLSSVVRPIYAAAYAESLASDAGRAPHSAWRNYDDMNEYFWSPRCLKDLTWPIKPSSPYLQVRPLPATAGQRRRRRHGAAEKPNKVGKTGFVEQRSFWNIFRSFDHLWTLLIVVLQAMMILAFSNDTGDGTKPPPLSWTLGRRDVQAALLTVFITWSGLRTLQAVLDAGMQYSLVTAETRHLAVRMSLKFGAAAAWTTAFSVLLTQAWQQRWADGVWSGEAEQKLYRFLVAAAAFLLPEAAALALLAVPWLRNAVERSDWRIVEWFWWWFQTRLPVGKGLRRGIVDSAKYGGFWLVIGAAKFSFSYFLQIRPMVQPTRQLLALRSPDFKWHEFFSNHNRFVVVLIWAPVVLIYVMDLQIWYSIFSSAVGGFIGLRSHIGEIRNVEQLKLRFPFFASAVGFNLMPEQEPLHTAGGASSSPLRRMEKLLADMVKRVKLRYGLGKAYTRKDPVKETVKLRQLWNEIIHYFRQEDLVSDREAELLEIPVDGWNVGVILWPSLLLSNQILIAVGLAQRWPSGGGAASRLWAKISKNEYRRCAVLESYYSIKHLLLSILLRRDSREHEIIENLFWHIEETVRKGTFADNYKLSKIPAVHERAAQLVATLLNVGGGGVDDLGRVVDAIQNLHEVVVRDFKRKQRQQPTDDEPKLAVDHGRMALPTKAGGGGDDDELLYFSDGELERGIFLPPKGDDDGFYRRLRRLSTTLGGGGSMEGVPRNLEARRRISFFSNSLFMDMPRAPPMEKMLAFSVLTPYFSEDVLYTKSQLRRPNEDGITILFYLQSVYPDEWENFLERKRLPEEKTAEATERRLWEENHAVEIRQWASYRGQTLARTVRGMMYYRRALELLSDLDAMSEVPGGGIRHGSSDDKPASLAALKFTYVVACQIYGKQKQKGDHHADDILMLMKQNAGALRVAYVDERPGGRYYSVLVKYDTRTGQEAEVYRIELPGPVKVGEGKPENQNHAIVFTRGEALQAIDMNQDNYFEEALKMRNLLEELAEGGGVGRRRRRLLGVREHVFTGSVSSLAWFMSAQEASFVTLGQRVLAEPLKVRMHYGHPDVFDRLWFATRGGISKASAAINISEDIFAGFNCTLRGGDVSHHEYIQVGKGRDVGLNQISLFEAKVSSGNGEQILSRDVYRLAHRLDFFRMLSFYFTSVGFYVSSSIVVLTVYAFLWGRVFLALSGLDAQIGGGGGAAAALDQQFIVQLGLFAALPMLVENALEMGFTRAIWDMLTMQLQLCSVFFAFSLGTRCHYFCRTLLHGGARYRATGRGFVVRRERFAENYRLYARSHFVKGVELMVLLIVYEAYHSGGGGGGGAAYILLTISSWFLAVSWIMAPFLFNPTGFDWLQLVYDFEDFQNWLWYKGGAMAKSDKSWEAWWNEEHDHLRTTGFWGRVAEIALSLRFFLIQYGMVYRLHIAANNKSIAVYFLSWIYVLVAALLAAAIGFAYSRYAAANHLYYRLVQFLVASFAVLVVVVLLQLSSFEFMDLVMSALAFLPTGWGLLSVALVAKPVLASTPVWPVVVAMARLYELAVAMVVMAPLAVLSWLPGVQAMQTRILFNEAFSRGLRMWKILAAAAAAEDRKPPSGDELRR